MLVTQSICPVCFKRVEGIFSKENGGVWMDKTCDSCETHVKSMVDRDSRWWAYCREHASPEYYKGYLVDITNDCNIRCKYCFHPKDKTYRSVSDVISELTPVDVGDPIFLTGGEPTLHPRITDILDWGIFREMWVLTNGTKIDTEDTFIALTSHGLIHEGNIAIGLSLHHESNGSDYKVLEICRKLGYKLGTVLCVIDDLKRINAYLDTLWVYRDVINNFRIKAATNLWDEFHADNRIYTSDLVKYIEGQGGWLDDSRNIKLNFAPMIWKGLSIAVMSWYDKWNVDVTDSECKPHYRANDGSINDIVVTGIINEGLACMK